MDEEKRKWLLHILDNAAKVAYRRSKLEVKKKDKEDFELTRKLFICLCDALR